MFLRVLHNRLEQKVLLVKSIIFLKNSFISEIVCFFSKSTDHFKWSIYSFMLLFFLEVEKLCKEIMLEKQSYVYFDIYTNG